jgi:hypothetical protein
LDFFLRSMSRSGDNQLIRTCPLTRAADNRRGGAAKSSPAETKSAATAASAAPSADSDLCADYVYCLFRYAAWHGLPAAADGKEAKPHGLWRLPEVCTLTFL